MLNYSGYMLLMRLFYYVYFCYCILYAIFLLLLPSLVHLPLLMYIYNT